MMARFDRLTISEVNLFTLILSLSKEARNTRSLYAELVLGSCQSEREDFLSEQAIEGKGSYTLVMTLAEDRRVKVGKLGTLDFPAGYYIYFGSALGGLKPRINRHLRRKKKRWWHVDSLTSVAKVPEVWWTVDEERRECSWARGALETSGATIPVYGFGASDCRCRSHLAYLQGWSDVEGVFNVLQRLSPCGLHVFKRV